MVNQRKPGKVHIGGYLAGDLVARFKAKIGPTGESMVDALRRLIENDLRGER